MNPFPALLHSIRPHWLGPIAALAGGLASAATPAATEVLIP